MFAQLGNIKFDLITYFNGLEETKKYNFVEHATIEKKPKLQFIGDELDEISINLNFHTNFCNPKTEIKRLKDTAAKHEALSFILGNGDYLGKYVIAEIASTTEQCDKQGNLIAIRADIKLKEWSAEQVKSQKKAKKQTIKKKKTAFKQPSKTAKTPKQIVRQE